MTKSEIWKDVLDTRDFIRSLTKVMSVVLIGEIYEATNVVGEC